MNPEQVIAASESLVDQGWATLREYWIGMHTDGTLDRARAEQLGAALYEAAEQSPRANAMRRWLLKSPDENITNFMFLLAGVAFGELQNRLGRDVLDEGNEPREADDGP